MKVLKLTTSFRDKKLSLDSEGYIQFKPFFNINLKSELKDINSKLLKILI